MRAGRRAHEDDVVRPLDARSRPRHRRRRRPRSAAAATAVRCSTSEHQQRALRRCGPAPAVSTAAGGLLRGGDERAVRRPGDRQRARAIVGRVGAAQVQAGMAERAGHEARLSRPVPGHRRAAPGRDRRCREIGLDVRLEAVLAQGLARDRADRDDARVRREGMGLAGRLAPPGVSHRRSSRPRRPQGPQEEAHRRGGRERDVVGRERFPRGRARAAARRRSHTAPARPPRRPARAARRAARRAPRSRARSGRARSGSSPRAPPRAPRRRSARARRPRTIPCSASASRGARADRRHADAPASARASRPGRPRQALEQRTPPRRGSSGRRGRTAPGRCGSGQRHGANARRLHDARPERLQAPRQLAGRARARVTATREPRQRRGPAARRARSASSATGPTTVIEGARTLLARGDVGDAREGARDSALAGQRAAFDDRRGLRARASGGDQRSLRCRASARTPM